MTEKEMRAARDTAAALGTADAHDALAARALLYSVFQSLFGNAPTQRLLDIAASEPVEEACAIAIGEVAREPFSLFGNAIAWAQEHVDEVGQSYARLFVGPRALPVPLWESVHRSGERLLFQETTLQVRSAYRSQGFQPACYPHVADDHLALELDFMTVLADRARAAWEADDEVALRDSLNASAAFLDEHLSRWLDAWCEGMAREDGLGLYASGARLLQAFVRADAAALRRMGEFVLG